MYKAKVYWERLNLIRKEKFDLILPGAMRDNGVDMWIHVIREGNPDPLAVDLGGDIGYFIFTDREQERVERAVLGGDEGILEQLEVYDIVNLVLKQWDLNNHYLNPKYQSEAYLWKITKTV